MSITTGFTMGMGSYLSQVIKNRNREKKLPIDLKQVFDYSLFGAFITAPTLRYWWYYLDLKLFKNKKTFLRPVKMMLVDIATVRFGIIASFVFYSSLCMGKSIKESASDFKKKIGPVFYESLKIWPAATLFNFYVVPLQLRVHFSSIIALIWNTYMAYLVTKGEKSRMLAKTL